MPKQKNFKPFIIFAVALIVLGVLVWQGLRYRERQQRLKEEELRQQLIENSTSPKRERTAEEQKQIDKLIQSSTAPSGNLEEMNTPALPPGGRRNRTVQSPERQKLIESSTAPVQ